MGTPRLLAILAHPDDESFGPGGTLARYAREGVQVHLCTVTDGAAGSSNSETASSKGKPTLAQRRKHELACACKVLGVRLHTLDYRDSGMERSPDNQHPRSLYQADLGDVARKLVRVIHQVRPHVIITHDPTGGYSHPDHIKVNRAVCRAWDLAADARSLPELAAGGDTTWGPERLYFTAIPRSMLKWFVRFVRLLGKDPRRFGQNRDIDLTRAGVADEQIHVRLDVGPYLSVKEQASACHKSQGGGGAVRVVPAFVRRRLMRHEFFVQAQPSDARPHEDLFEGIHH